MSDFGWAEQLAAKDNYAVQQGEMEAADVAKTREYRFWDARFIRTIKALAPGTPLRDGLENVLRAKMGALILIADNPDVLKVVDGGFTLNSDYTPAGFYELAKMDGAIVLSQDASRILYANAQLTPDSTIPTSETGTRHRTAERVARQTGAAVVAISQRRNIITLYLGNLRYTLKDITTILSRANQALQTLEKYVSVLQKGLSRLSALEFEGSVTLGDVANVLVRAEHVNRVIQEIRRHIIELGSEGVLISMQMEELMPEEDNVRLLIKDYCVSPDNRTHELVYEQIRSLPEENLEPFSISRILGYSVTPTVIDIPVISRGYRLLRQVPRLPMAVVENIVDRFKSLNVIFNATINELDEVEGIGEVRAKTIKDGLKIRREQALLDRYI